MHTTKQLIFDRFRQGEEGSTKNYSGHGLGLSICNSLLEIIDGAMLVESEPLKETVFTILIQESKSVGNEAITSSDDGNDFVFTDSDSVIF